MRRVRHKFHSAILGHDALEYIQIACFIRVNTGKLRCIFWLPRETH